MKNEDWIEGLKAIMLKVTPPRLWAKIRNPDAFYHIICQKACLNELSPDVRQAFDELLSEREEK